MPLVLTVSLIALGVIVIVGVAAYFIDQDIERRERSGNGSRDR